VKNGTVPTVDVFLGMDSSIYTKALIFKISFFKTLKVYYLCTKKVSIAKLNDFATP